MNGTTQSTRALSDNELDQLIDLAIKHSGGDGRTEEEIKAICRWARGVRWQALLLDSLFAEQIWISGFKDGEPCFSPVQSQEGKLSGRE